MFRRLLGAGCAASLLALAVPALASGHVIEFNASWGGFDAWARPHYENLCQARAPEFVFGAGRRWPAKVAVTDGRVGHGPETVNGSLYCHELPIPLHTRSHEFSIRCPAGERSISGGAGYFVEHGVRVHQLTGKLGHEPEDGYLDYTFRQVGGGDRAWMHFWAVCVDR
jgi:hypothetical protein